LPGFRETGKNRGKTMQSEKLTIAHSLYAFYESLPDDIQQTFLQKLFHNSPVIF